MSPLLTDDELPKPRYYVVNGYLYTSRGAAENSARMISPTEGESLPVDALYTAEQMRARDRAVEARVREKMGEVPTALVEAVDTLLECAPCECPHRMREKQGEHFSHCYLFDLNVARSGAGEKR